MGNAASHALCWKWEENQNKPSSAAHSETAPKTISPCFMSHYHTQLTIPIKKNSVSLVRERTIPTERPPPVGEVSANIYG